MASVQFHLSSEHERAAAGSIHPTILPVNPPTFLGTLALAQASVHFVPNNLHYLCVQVFGFVLSTHFSPLAFLIGA